MKNPRPTANEVNAIKANTEITMKKDVSRVRSLRRLKFLAARDKTFVIALKGRSPLIEVPSP